MQTVFAKNTIIFCRTVNILFSPLYLMNLSNILVIFHVSVIFPQKREGKMFG